MPAVSWVDNFYYAKDLGEDGLRARAASTGWRADW